MWAPCWRYITKFLVRRSTSTVGRLNGQVRLPNVRMAIVGLQEHSASFHGEARLQPVRVVVSIDPIVISASLPIGIHLHFAGAILNPAQVLFHKLPTGMLKTKNRTDQL